MRFPDGTLIGRLMSAPMRPGRVEWIGARPQRRAPMSVLETSLLIAGRGLEEDRYARADGMRQVTLITSEALLAIASHLGRDEVAPEALRRNILVRGLNLLALKGARFRIAGALLETTGECHPCSFLESSLGPGGYNAARGLGGVTARVLEGGPIRIGDPVVRHDEAPSPSEAALKPV